MFTLKLHNSHRIEVFFKVDDCVQVCDTFLVVL